MDWNNVGVNQAASPRAYAVLKESTDWGKSANDSGHVDMGDAVAKLHELLNKTIVALADVEAEATTAVARAQRQIADDQRYRNLNQH